MTIVVCTSRGNRLRQTHIILSLHTQPRKLSVGANIINNIRGVAAGSYMYTTSRLNFFLRIFTKTHIPIIILLSLLYCY